VSKGWAIEEDGEVDVRTVSPTRIAAIVNWMLVSADLMIMRGATDEWISREFAGYEAARGVHAVEVAITKVLHS